MEGHFPYFSTCTLRCDIFLCMPCKLSAPYRPAWKQWVRRLFLTTKIRCFI
ncbi:hypothetical protein KsCSTR_11860 [Candidatus Kuenenia stuttgartiensis]|uniref:Uncharacterized protein n=1 Tax=Kuenenia stuttgartiensis TaxID=174633 RepID=Q1PYC9_KUEST|nr:hypothetical protein KsCSTR_11860 [Candidatus Kuenenia stuttgartiensis]CAJ72081.1 unknown protein [Candidatus Kuenenia stuttgartiensis]